MRLLRHVLAASVLALVLASAASPATPGRTVAIFFYPWYGTPAIDGSYQQWSQNGHTPPLDLYSDYFPLRGVYSSTDPGLLDRQMAEIRAAGIDAPARSRLETGKVLNPRLATLHK